MNLLNPLPSWREYPKGTPEYATSQYFGENPATYAQFGLAGHNGLDLATALGTPVAAMHDGWIVEATAKDTGYGLRITHYFEADNFGWDITYGHFQRVNYPNIPWDINRRNFPVRAGDIIGYVDSTGFSSGNHLHVTLRKYSLNPLQLLNSNNGFKGAIDILPFINNTMSNVQFVHKAGTQEFGFYVPATSEETLKDKSKNFGLVITKPDGSVEFSKAKEITFN